MTHAHNTGALVACPSSAFGRLWPFMAGSNWPMTARCERPHPERNTRQHPSGSKAACSAIAAEHTRQSAIDPAASRDRRSGN